MDNPQIIMTVHLMSLAVLINQIQDSCLRIMLKIWKMAQRVILEMELVLELKASIMWQPQDRSDHHHQILHYRQTNIGSVCSRFSNHKKFKNW